MAKPIFSGFDLSRRYLGCLHFQSRVGVPGDFLRSMACLNWGPSPPPETLSSCPRTGPDPLLSPERTGYTPSPPPRLHLRGSRSREGQGGPARFLPGPAGGTGGAAAAAAAAGRAMAEGVGAPPQFGRPAPPPQTGWERLSELWRRE